MTETFARRVDSSELMLLPFMRLTSPDCACPCWGRWDASDTNHLPLTRCHGTRAHNICTCMGRFLVRRTQHVSRDLDRRDALDTTRSAENSTICFSCRNRRTRTRCALHPRTERVYPCWGRLDASGTSHSTATAHLAPMFHSTCSIHSWLFSFQTRR